MMLNRMHLRMHLILNHSQRFQSSLASASLARSMRSFQDFKWTTGQSHFHSTTLQLKRKPGSKKDPLDPDDKDDDESSQKDHPEEPAKETNGRVSGRSREKPGLEKIVAQVAEKENNTVERITIPDEFPQIIPIPLNRRPLFPGFYKSLYIKDPNVIQAIQNLVERRRPYVGIFLTKDDNVEGDVVKDLDDIYRTGVFAQITNTYQTGPDSSALTVVVYPHRRIRIKSNNLLAPPQFFEGTEGESGPVDENWKGMHHYHTIL